MKEETGEIPLRSSDTLPPTPARKPRQRRTGVLFAVLIIGISLAIVTLTTLNYHPRWHTVAGKHEPGGIVIEIDCPENWVLTDSPGAGSPPTGTSPFLSTLAVKPRPLTGLPLWWRKYALRQPDASRAMTYLYAYALRDQTEPQGAKPRTRADADSLLNGFEYGQRRGLPPGAATTIRRVEHSLGPALETDYTYSAPSPALKTGGTGSLPASWHVHGLYIVPLAAPPDDNVLILGAHIPAGEYAAMEPDIKRMLRSIRFVRKADAARF